MRNILLTLLYQIFFKKFGEYSRRWESVSYEYTVITNVYSGGIPAVEAGSLVAEKAMEIVEHKAAGNRLETILNVL